MNEIKIKWVNIDAVIPYENNPRINDDAVIPVANSIKEFGFKNPIIIDKDNVIIAGHTRLKASKHLGLEKVPVIVADDLTPDQVKAFRIADNKVGELAIWDNELLEIELENIELDMSAFDLNNYDIETTIDDEPEREIGLLKEKFIIPPFDIFDARKGAWLERKRMWNNLIKDDASARSNAKAFGGGSVNSEHVYDYYSVMKSDVSILDPVLSEVILTWFTPTGTNNKCLDCFAGDTVFGYVASYLGNDFVGIELRKEQADFNNDHTNDKAVYYCDDGRNVRNHVPDNSIDLLFSCPPYFDLEVYSDLENDASNQSSYEEFYEILDTAFAESIKCLKDDRFAVIVCGDVRNKKTGGYYSFPNDIINTFERNGMILYNNIKLLTPLGTAQLRVGNNMKSRKTVHVYQDVLVFYKGDQKNIKNIFKEIEVADISDYESDDI